jgi:hypothetical protein
MLLLLVLVLRGGGGLSERRVARTREKESCVVK